MNYNRVIMQSFHQQEDASLTLWALFQQIKAIPDMRGSPSRENQKVRMMMVRDDRGALSNLGYRKWRPPRAVT